MGQFLSPQHGFWQNAEPTDESFDGRVELPGMKGKGDVYFDENLIPHVFADNRSDACFIQGYLHAKFRLWQMEFQSFAAAGRVSEVLGAGPNNNYIKYDRGMRRLGMVTAAKAMLAKVETDSDTRADCDAYTAGVNAYITQLSASDLAAGVQAPELRAGALDPTLKSMLFVKYMAFDLAGGDNDFQMTNAKAFFSKEDFCQTLSGSAGQCGTPSFRRGRIFSRLRSS